jgi:hypothetical protein
MRCRRAHRGWSPREFPAPSFQVDVIVGGSQTIGGRDLPGDNGSVGAPLIWAYSKAQRGASLDSSDPSTPTTRQQVRRSCPRYPSFGERPRSVPERGCWIFCWLVRDGHIKVPGQAAAAPKAAALPGQGWWRWQRLPSARSPVVSASCCPHPPPSPQDAPLAPQPPNARGHIPPHVTLSQLRWDG